ncbi:MAG: LysE family translocator [Caldilineaceae bacterium]
MVSTEFLLTSLIIVMIPGTGAIYTISTGLFHGRRASLIAAIGCTLGIVPHLLTTILGLSFILHTSALLFQGLKWLGVLYLLYLAWLMWRDEGALRFDGERAPQSPWRIIVRAIFINLLNPKLTIFFLAFLQLFIAPHAASPVGQMVMLSGVFMGLTLLVSTFYGLLASSVRAHVLNSPGVIRWLQRAFALTFAALGLKLVLER